MRRWLGYGLVAAVSAAAAAGVTATAIGAATSASDIARRQIWAKEMAIYEGRAQGKVDYYVNNTSPQYLAWTAGTPAPFTADVLREGGKKMVGHAQEKISTELTGFTMTGPTQTGPTAIIYYMNHRTMTSDGRPVDQYYANIHVWVKEKGDWKVLASMSREVPPPVKP